MIQNDSLASGFLHFERDWRVVQARTNESVQFRTMGLELDLSDPERVRIAVPQLLELHRGGSTQTSMNGAVVAFLCDAAVGFTSIRSGIPLRLGSGVGRLEIRMGRPLEGPSAEARSWIEKIRRNLIYAAAEIVDHENRVCHRARGVIYMRRETGENDPEGPAAGARTP